MPAKPISPRVRVTAYAESPRQAEAFLAELASRFDSGDLRGAFRAETAPGPFRWVATAETAPESQAEGFEADAGKALERILEWLRNGTASRSEDEIVLRRLTDLGYL